MSKYDVIIVGSGIGGLCCGSILALSGKKVLICEAHTQPGGVAHSFKKKDTFEFGPSIWSGIGKLTLKGNMFFMDILQLMNLGKFGNN